MSRRAHLQRRPVLLAGAAATGVVTTHLLDALGLLPGVHEPLAVRAAALAPRYTFMAVIGAGLLALAAESLLRRQRPWQAAVLLVAGQTALLTAPEALAEAAGKTGGGDDGQEIAKLTVAVGLQVVLAVLAVGVAVIVDALLLQLPRPLSLVRVPDLPRAAVTVPGVPIGRIAGGVRGRGPPVPVIP